MVLKIQQVNKRVIIQRQRLDDVLFDVKNHSQSTLRRFLDTKCKKCEKNVKKY